MSAETPLMPRGSALMAGPPPPPPPELRRLRPATVDLIGGRMATPADDPTAITREMLGSAHCIESFSITVHGASREGERAVILAVFPPGARGWTFPLPAAEARRIASMLMEVAGDGD